MMEVTSLEGPVILYRGSLTLRIPLAAGGAQLAPCARGIGEVDGEFLNITIMPWMAEQLRIGAGSFVFVDNEDGKLNITRSARNDEATPPE